MTSRSACNSRLKKHNKGTYRSGLEVKNQDYLKSLGIDGQYEENYLIYIVPSSEHKYTPDFVLPNGIIIETKGVWDAEDRKKHLLIKEQHPELDIRFVFTRSKAPIYKGSKTTYASFCEKNNIKYADKLIPREWIDEPVRKVEGLYAKTRNRT